MPHLDVGKEQNKHPNASLNALYPYARCSMPALAARLAQPSRVLFLRPYPLPSVLSLLL